MENQHMFVLKLFECIISSQLPTASATQLQPAVFLNNHNQRNHWSPLVFCSLSNCTQFMNACRRPRRMEGASFSCHTIAYYKTNGKSTHDSFQVLRMHCIISAANKQRNPIVARSISWKSPSAKPLIPTGFASLGQLHSIHECLPSASANNMCWF